MPKKINLNLIIVSYLRASKIYSKSIVSFKKEKKRGMEKQKDNIESSNEKGLEKRRSTNVDFVFSSSHFSTKVEEDGVEEKGDDKHVDFVLVHKSQPSETRVSHVEVTSKEEVEEDKLEVDHSQNNPENPEFVADGTQTETEETVGESVLRIEYIKNLIDLGLDVDKAVSNDGTVFYKLSVPFETMIKYAEILGMKMPFSESLETLGRGPLSHFCSWAYSCPDMDYDRSAFPDIPYMHTMQFTEGKEGWFLIDENDKNSFFSQSQRDTVVDLLLSEAEFEDYEEIELNGKGFLLLLSMGAFSDAFPLHDGGRQVHESSMRRKLYKNWALGSGSTWFTIQPLDHIRSYFGDKVGFYFCWLDFYIKMFIPLCIIGLIMFITSIIVMEVFPPQRVKEICNDTGPGNLTVCILCLTCPRKKLHELCSDGYRGALFDNDATTYFGFCMAIWSLLFTQFWKRVESRLCLAWHVDDNNDIFLKENIRPQCADAKFHKKFYNEITDKIESKQRSFGTILRRFSSIIMLSIVVALMVATYFGIVFYRVIFIYLYEEIGDKSIKDAVPFLVSFTSGLLVLFLTIHYNFFYHRISGVLTNLEMPRTQSEWDDIYTWKYFIFSFITEHGILFYIGFYSTDFYKPGQGLFGFDLEVSGPEGNMYHLCIILCIVIIGKCCLRLYYHRRAVHSSKESYEKRETRWEQDYSLSPVPAMFLVRSYIDMIVLYSYVSMYAVSFPLAPFIVLIYALIETRLSAHGFIVRWRRPLYKAVRGAGIILNIMKIVSFAAVLSTGSLLAVSSELIPQFLYNYYYYPEDENRPPYTTFRYSFHDPRRKRVQDSIIRVTSTNNTNTSLIQNTNNLATPSARLPYEESLDPCYFRGFFDQKPDSNAIEPTAVHWHVQLSRLVFVMTFSCATWLAARAVTFVTYDLMGGVAQLAAIGRHKAQDLLMYPDRAGLLYGSSSSFMEDAENAVEEEGSG